MTRSSNAPAPGPEIRCWTLHDHISDMDAFVLRTREYSHVPDVEQACLLSRPPVTVPHAEVAVLHRHGVTGERHHLPLVSHM